MDTYITAHSAHSLGRWLATLAVSLVLLALAYAHAPDPASYLGFSLSSNHSLATSRPAPAPALPSSHRLATSQAPVVASAQLSYPDEASRLQFAR